MSFFLLCHQANKSVQKVSCSSIFFLYLNRIPLDYFYSPDEKGSKRVFERCRFCPYVIRRVGVMVQCQFFFLKNFFDFIDLICFIYFHQYDVECRFEFPRFSCRKITNTVSFISTQLHTSNCRDWSDNQNVFFIRVSYTFFNKFFYEYKSSRL